ncbi:hypothetical protein ABZ904_08470 [Streptomyces sp. NPDC046900]|uniref:hypothetical protein n=1 Tax=Streptomyces sp. NPDC046900 TaxID=3155473 RepID=UPI0033C98520
MSPFTTAENYPGELAMLRGLVNVLRVVAPFRDMAEVQRLLDEHARDEQDAYAQVGEKCSRPAADATPGPTGRVAQLLDAIRTARGRWTTTRARRFYRDNVRALDHMHDGQLRTIARGDLRDLAAWGHLVRHEEPGRQFYVLKTRKDGA